MARRPEPRTPPWVVAAVAGTMAAHIATWALLGEGAWASLLFLGAVVALVLWLSERRRRDMS